MAENREYSSIMTADWYIQASTNAPPGTTLMALSIFWDATVRSSSGAKYCPVMFFNNHLPNYDQTFLTRFVS